MTSSDLDPSGQRRVDVVFGADGFDQTIDERFGVSDTGADLAPQKHMSD